MWIFTLEVRSSLVAHAMGISSTTPTVAEREMTFLVMWLCVWSIYKTLVRVNVYVYVYCSCNFSLCYSYSYSCLFARRVRSVYNHEELEGCLHWSLVYLFQSIFNNSLQALSLSLLEKCSIIQPSGSSPIFQAVLFNSLQAPLLIPIACRLLYCKAYNYTAFRLLYCTFQIK